MDAPTRYIVKTSTSVQLGSGLVAYLKPIPAEVWLARLGHIPLAFANTVAAQNSQVRKAESEAFTRDHPDFAARLAMVLLGSVVALGSDTDDPMPTTLVEKPQAECGAHELSVTMLTAEDIETITGAALRLNGLDTEAAETAKPFFRGRPLAVFFGLLSSTLRPEPARPTPVAGDGLGEGAGDHAGGREAGTH